MAASQAGALAALAAACEAAAAAAWSLLLHAMPAAPSPLLLVIQEAPVVAPEEGEEEFGECEMSV